MFEIVGAALEPRGRKPQAKAEPSDFDSFEVVSR